MAIKNKTILFTSGIMIFIYFFAPVLADVEPFDKLLGWVFNTNFFIFSGGIYGGLGLYLSGDFWPIFIQTIIFLFCWFIIYKLASAIYQS